MPCRRFAPRAALSSQVKRLDGGVGYGGDWTVRITATEDQAEGAGNESPRRISLLFYVANEDVRCACRVAHQRSAPRMPGHSADRQCSAAADIQHVLTYAHARR